MDEKERQEFSLEDIIREFSDSPADVAQEPEILPEEAPEEEAVQEEAAAQETAQEEVPAEEPVVREEAPAQQTAVTEETVRLDIPIHAKGPVRIAQPLEEDEEEAPAEAPAPQADAAFGENWQPQYEEPIAEYVPPQPIIFQPRSRLRELKKKLVAGPERRYYELSEKGLGKLQAAIFFCFLLVLACAVITVMYALGMVPENRLRLMVFVQFLALLLSALLGCGQIIEGFADLFKGRFTQNTLLVVTFAACCADGVFGLLQLRISCCAAFSLISLMSLWSAYQRCNTQLGQLDTMRKATTLDAVTVRKDYYSVTKKKKTRVYAGLLRGEGQVEPFMEHYDVPSKPENVLNIYALISFVVALGIGVTAFVLYDIPTAVQVLAVSLLAATPATIFITLTRPMAILERRLHSVGAVLCGWRGVKLMKQRAVFPITHQDLFPANCARMNGVKFFGKRDPDEVVSCATALIEASGSGIAPLFTQLAASRNVRHYTVSQLSVFDGGVSGSVGGLSVAAGSVSFLRSINVEVPESARVSNGIYVVIENELSGLFAMSYEKNRWANAGLCALCAYRKLNPILTDNDFTLTEGFLRSKFNASVQKLIRPDYDQQQALQQKVFDPEDPTAMLVTRPSLAAFAYGVTGARSVHTASIFGATVHLLGGILGLGIMLALTLLGAIHLLTPFNLFAYQLVWMIPGLMITEWTRHV